ncbi:tetratricopeptide repeat-containing sensor histidine kinase [Edaphocola aurantiacus]|uniref:tetratricopeptide repeat-containing sensor histidine kinase n=1 Tax=Edaphocola aurantiacus TaxID=2601682 RepID=UPI001C973FD0|nr:tetratricopeptide repeat protein [Edaphocola aurantiacus]
MRKAIVLLLLLSFCSAKASALPTLDTNAVKANIKTITDSITANPAFAKDLASRTLQASQQINYPWGIFMNTLALGSIAYNNGEREQAIKLHQTALAYGRSHGFKQKEAIVLSNLAKDYGGSGNTKKAIALYHEAMKVAQEINDSAQIGISLQGLGQTYSNIGYSEEAIKYCSQAAEIFIKKEKYSSLRFSYNHIASAYIDLSQFDSAYRYVWLSKRAYDATGATVPQLDFYMNMAICCDSLKMKDSAAYYFEKVIIAAREVNDEIALQPALAYLAIKEAAAGNTTKAIKYYKEALLLTEKFNNLEGSITITGSLAKLYAKNGDYANAYEYALKEAAFREDYINQEKINAVTALNAKFEKQQLQYEFDKKTAATALANQQKIAKRNMLLYGFITLALLLGVVIIFVVKSFRQKAIITANKNEQLKQRLLLTQMNPHFIFNSVDNIQSLIHSNKDEEAINYLTKFSKLTRQILENSRENYIGLDEELNMLDNYMNIQKLLYNNNFTHKVTVDEGIDPEAVLLPPMLTQPFIENAIRHGLKHKKEGGIIHVRFYMKAQQLFFEVTDNGTGLAEKETAEGQRSLSTQITRERLESIASDKKITIHTLNITGENNTIQGVKTFFEIPYSYN